MIVREIGGRGKEQMGREVKEIPIGWGGAYNAGVWVANVT